VGVDVGLDSYKKAGGDIVKYQIEMCNIVVDKR
jgi:hypothetical protein